MATRLFERPNVLFLRGAEVPMIRLPCGLQGIPRPCGSQLSIVAQQAKHAFPAGEPKPPSEPPPPHLFLNVTARSKAMPKKNRKRPRSPSHFPVRPRSNSRSRRRSYNTEGGSRDKRRGHWLSRSRSRTRSWPRKKHKEHKKPQRRRIAGDEDSDSDAWGNWTERGLKTHPDFAAVPEPSLASPRSPPST